MVAATSVRAARPSFLVEPSSCATGPSSMEPIRSSDVEETAPTLLSKSLRRPPPSGPLSLCNARLAAVGHLEDDPTATRRQIWP